jgi:ribosomal protein S18 acetylase RimI-like enzyme
MEIILRRIVPADVKTLSAIAKSSFYDTFVGTCTDEDMQGFLDHYYNEQRLLSEINMPGNYYYFAEVDGTPVAFLQYMEDYSGFPLMKKWKALELKRLYVLTEYHGKGIAQILTDHFMKFGEEHDYEVVWLGVWEHNLRAQKFYSKYGFEDSGHMHPFPIGSTPQTDKWFWKFLKPVSSI